MAVFLMTGWIYVRYTIEFGACFEGDRGIRSAPTMYERILFRDYLRARGGVVYLDITVLASSWVPSINTSAGRFAKMLTVTMPGNIFLVPMLTRGMHA